MSNSEELWKKFRATLGLVAHQKNELSPPSPDVKKADSPWKYTREEWRVQSLGPKNWRLRDEQSDTGGKAELSRFTCEFIRCSGDFAGPYYNRTEGMQFRESDVTYEFKQVGGNVEVTINTPRNGWVKTTRDEVGTYTHSIHSMADPDYLKEHVLTLWTPET